MMRVLGRSEAGIGLGAGSVAGDGRVSSRTSAASTGRDFVACSSGTDEPATSDSTLGLASEEEAGGSSTAIALLLDEEDSAPGGSTVLSWALMAVAGRSRELNMPLKPFSKPESKRAEDIED